MQATRAIFLCLILVGLTFCSSLAGDKKIPNYYPLEVGNEWHYRAEVGGKSVTFINRIVRTETVDGVELAILEASVDGKVVASEHLRQTDKGIFRHRNNGMALDPPFCLLPFPVKEGEKWSGMMRVGDSKGEYKAETSMERVAVPAGRYATTRVNIEMTEGGNKVTTSYWWAEGVGFVKQSFEAGPVSATLVLEKMVRKEKK